jgi:hemoglobin-like flavoprotein
MRAEQIELVQRSFAKVEPIAEQAAATFYSRLFELDPGLRNLFQTDLGEQGRRLMAMIAQAVQGLGDVERLLPILRALGRRHAGYGVRSRDYDTVGAALIWTLEQGLGSAFDQPTREAWKEVYGVMSDTMLAAAGQAAAQAVIDTPRKDKPMSCNQEVAAPRWTACCAGNASSDWRPGSKRPNAGRSPSASISWRHGCTPRQSRGSAMRACAGRWTWSRPT